MNKICLFALLIAVASANIATDISLIQLSRQTLSCLSSKNVSRVILEISDDQGTINKDFLNGFIFAKDAGISTVDAIVIVNDNFTTNGLSANVTAALPMNFNGTVWLKVLNSPNLWTHDVSRRVAYLENLVLAFKQRSVEAGIYSDANTWASVMGSQGAGSDSLKSAPVWYVNENNVQSFDDFSYAGFGTWTKPALKNFQKNAYMCYVWVASLDYYEAETQFKKIDQQRFLSF